MITQLFGLFHGSIHPFLYLQRHIEDTRGWVSVHVQGVIDACSHIASGCEPFENPGIAFFVSSVKTSAMEITHKAVMAPGLVSRKVQVKLIARLLTVGEICHDGPDGIIPFDTGTFISTPGFVNHRPEEDGRSYKHCYIEQYPKCLFHTLEPLASYNEINYRCLHDEPYKGSGDNQYGYRYEPCFCFFFHTQLLLRCKDIVNAPGQGLSLLVGSRAADILHGSAE